MNLYRYLLFTFIVATLFACKKEERREITDLTFTSDTYYVSEGTELFLYINQGNQKYQVEVADKSLVETRVDETLWPAGGIYVSGLKKGDTKVIVKDLVTGQQAELTIHVVDPYLVLEIGSLHPVIKVDPQTPQPIYQQILDEVKTYETRELNPLVILYRNAAQEFFTFEKEKDLQEGNYKHSGTYELSYKEGGEQVLKLHYAEEEETSTFSLLAESPYAKNALSSFAGNVVDSRKHSAIKLATSDLIATSPIEHYEDYFLLNIELTSTFQTKYPQLESAWLTQQARLVFNYQDYAKIGDGILK